MTRPDPGTGGPGVDKRYDIDREYVVRMQGRGAGSPGQPKPIFMMCETLLFPINAPGHWSLAVADTKKLVVDIIDPMWKTRKHEDMLAHGLYIQSWFDTQYSMGVGRHAPTYDIRVMRAPQQWNGMFCVSRVHESGCAPVEVGPPIFVSVH